MKNILRLSVLPYWSAQVLNSRIGSPAAACSSPADSATGCSWTNHASLVSRRIHRLLRVPPTGSSASGIFISDALGPEGRVRTSGRTPAKKKSHDAMFFVNTAGRVRTSRRMSAKKLPQDKHPPVRAAHDAMFFVNTPSPAAACSSPADSATGCSRTNHASFVSRRMHRLLRVPPTGSSASGVFMCFDSPATNN